LDTDVANELSKIGLTITINGKAASLNVNVGDDTYYVNKLRKIDLTIKDTLD